MNIIWKRPDGCVAITLIGSVCKQTPAEHADYLKERGDIPSDWEIVGIDCQLPQDRSFRDAWEHDGRGISVSLSKARDITRQRLRRERAPLLRELDVAFMRATEAGAKTSDIVAEKNRLRDITDLVEAATTVEQLKSIRCRNS